MSQDNILDVFMKKYLLIFRQFG